MCRFHPLFVGEVAIVGKQGSAGPEKREQERKETEQKEWETKHCGAHTRHQPALQGPHTMLNSSAPLRELNMTPGSYKLEIIYSVQIRANRQYEPAVFLLVFFQGKKCSSEWWLLTGERKSDASVAAHGVMIGCQVSLSQMEWAQLLLTASDQKEKRQKFVRGVDTGQLEDNEAWNSDYQRTVLSY